MDWLKYEKWIGLFALIATLALQACGGGGGGGGDSTDSLTPSVSISHEWYWGVRAPNAPDVASSYVLVGPYASNSDCADMLGSAIYYHPFSCHLGSGDCRILGNGFIHPQDLPYRIPSDSIWNGIYQLCQQIANGPRYSNSVFVFYSNNFSNISVESCDQYADALDLAKTVVGDAIGFYFNSDCPGAPCFTTTTDTACN